MDTQGWTCSERQGQNIQGRQLLRCLPVIPHSGYRGPCVITSMGWPGKLLQKNMAEVMGHPPEIRLQRLWFHLAHPLSLSPVLTRMESTCWVVSCPREQSTWQWGPVASYSRMSEPGHGLSPSWALRWRLHLCEGPWVKWPNEITWDSWSTKTVK